MAEQAALHALRMSSALRALLILPLMSSALAADRQSALDECGALSQAGMRECLIRKAAESRALLKQSETDTSAALARWDEDPRYLKLAKDRLAGASKAFERYREAQCLFDSSLGGGAIANALELRRLACDIELNEARAASLRERVAKLPRR